MLCSPTAGGSAQICSFPPSASPREAQPGDLRSAERGESTRMMSTSPCASKGT